jgi:hypothetical protein
MLFTRRVSKIPLARTITTKTTRPETATISQRLKIVEFLTLSVLFVAPAPAVSSLVGSSLRLVSKASNSWRRGSSCVRMAR